MPPLSRGYHVIQAARSLASRVPAITRLQSTKGSRSRDDFLKVSEEVRYAIATGKPVVALESTIYTHGFPYPENIALSSQLESLVRVNGGVPATIGILNGVARVGMEAEELIELVSSAGSPDTWKISRRDLGFISGLGLTGRRLNGGTTIAGTMILAHLAGIKVFATGGLGGVHRGGENSLDISADLTELGRTPVTVISSGCKSFLDIPRTLEYLETQGVGVGTFADGREGPVDFPAFFSRDSGVRSPQVIQNEFEAAAIVFAQTRFPLQSGLLFANPVPVNAAMSKADIDSIIGDALRLADSKGIHGAENTPFVLKQIRELSGGRSVIANRALIGANVVRGTKVAVELAKLELQEKGLLERSTSVSVQVPTSSVAKVAESRKGIDRRNPSTFTGNAEEAAKVAPPPPPQEVVRADILVFGSLASDLICDYNPLISSGDETTPALYTSNPAIITQSAGGVGYNIALAAKYAGASVLLCSVVADDLAGDLLSAQLASRGLSRIGVEQLRQADGFRTAQYVAINDKKKDLVMAMADMAILQDSSLDMSDRWQSLISSLKPKWIVVDGNWSPLLLSQIISIANKEEIKLAFEPVSVQKSVRIFQPDAKIVTSDGVVPRHRISLATPNTYELEMMYQTARQMAFFESPEWWETINSFEMSSAGSRDRLISMTNVELVDKGIPQQAIQLLPYIPNLVVKLGKQGCLLTYLLPQGDPCLSSPDSAPYILSRSTSHKSVVGGVYMRLFPPAEAVRQDEIVSVNGVGDTMLGVLMAGLVYHGSRLEEVIPVAQQGAVRTLKSAAAVSPTVQELKDMIENTKNQKADLKT